MRVSRSQRDTCRCFKFHHTRAVHTEQKFSITRIMPGRNYQRERMGRNLARVEQLSSSSESRSSTISWHELYFIIIIVELIVKQIITIEFIARRWIIAKRRGSVPRIFKKRKEDSCWFRDKLCSASSYIWTNVVHLSTPLSVSTSFFIHLQGNTVFSVSYLPSLATNCFTLACQTKLARTWISLGLERNEQHRINRFRLSLASFSDPLFRRDITNLVVDQILSRKEKKKGRERERRKEKEKKREVRIVNVLIIRKV